jgi:large subunit ribosomal protein L3
MVAGLWGKKIGMTQLFAEDAVIPVTAINVGRWVITNIKSEDRDGYAAVQVGLIKERYAQEQFSPEWLKKMKNYFALVREIKQVKGGAELAVGQVLDCSTVLNQGDKVDLFGVTTGRGFAGGIKRHGFSGGCASHGSKLGKRPGSVSHLRSEGRVIPGKRLPGHMGVVRRFMGNLEVVKVDKDADLVLVKGSVPGKGGSLVFMRKA